MKNILLIKGESQYGAMRLYIEELSVAFRGLGFNTMVLDSVEYSFQDQLNEALSLYHFDILFTCNAQYIELHKEVGDYFVSYLCDHPGIHRRRYVQADHKCLFIQCDADQKKFAQEYYPDIGKVGFVPLSGSYNPEYIPYENRRYNVVFTGSYTEPAAYLKNFLGGFSGQMKSFVKFMADTIISEPELALDQVLTKALSVFHLDVDRQEYLELMFDFSAINIYARCYYRDILIRAVTDGGLRVDVFGNGWESFETGHPENLVIHKESAYVAQKVVADARISLNTMPWFKAGFQERIATAMLSGTIAVTDSSAYIKQNFEDGENVILYSLRDIEAVVPKIKQLLDDTGEASRIALNGKDLAESKHTWFQRAQEIVGQIEEFCGKECQNKGQGEILQLSYRTIARGRNILLDNLSLLDEKIKLIQELEEYSVLNLYDYSYILKKTACAVERIEKTFPDCFFPSYAWKLLKVTGNKSLEPKAELLIMVLRNMREQLLELDYAYAVNWARQMERQKNVWDTKYHRLVAQRVISNYADSKDSSIQEILSIIRQTKRIEGAYLYYYVMEYLNRDISEYGTVGWDPVSRLSYTFYMGKKMYYPGEMLPEGVLQNLRLVMIEQDPRSPHVYLDEKFDVKHGDVVIDAGVAEGNFGLSIIDKVSKLYLVECEEKWIEALEQTFAPYREKVVIVQKMLGDFDDETHITIDSLLNGETVNFIKMDIEGAELQALKGAEYTLAHNDDLKCAICSYHKKNDEQNITRILSQYGFNVSTTNGYMFFRFDEDSLIDGELRRGIVRGVKQGGSMSLV